MVTSGTNTVLMNTIGKMNVNTAACTASVSLMANPTAAEIHENEKPTASTKPITPSAPRSPFWNRKPIR